jgi:hypothetical protein
MYSKLAVDRDEVLFRVFFRGPDQVSNEANLVDFERRPKVRNSKEGGLSFCRPSLMSLKTLIEVTKRRDEPLSRGLAFTRAANFLDLGYELWGDPTKPGHVCLHCPSCNYAEFACASLSGACPLDGGDLLSDDEIRARLAELMTVSIEASATSEILSVFASDIDESDLAQANELYLSRWANRKTVQ